MQDSHPKTFSLNQAAVVLGRHRNTIAEWLAAGCPAVQKADRDQGIEWKLFLGDVLDWRVSHEVQEALARYHDEKGEISRDEADRRRAVARMIVEEIAADEALGVVVRRDEAEADMAAFALALKSGLSNAANRIAARAAAMRSAPDIRGLCEKELNRALDTAHAELVKRWAVDQTEGGADAALGCGTPLGASDASDPSGSCSTLRAGRGPEGPER